MTDEIVEMIEEVEIIDHHTIVTIDGTIEVEEMIVGMIEIGETLDAKESAAGLIHVLLFQGFAKILFVIFHKSPVLK